MKPDLGLRNSNIDYWPSPDHSNKLDLKFRVKLRGEKRFLMCLEACNCCKHSACWRQQCSLIIKYVKIVDKWKSPFTYSKWQHQHTRLHGGVTKLQTQVTIILTVETKWLLWAIWSHCSAKNPRNLISGSYRPLRWSRVHDYKAIMYFPRALTLVTEVTMKPITNGVDSGSSFFALFS